MRELVVLVRGKVDKLKQDIKSATKGIVPSPVKSIGKKGTEAVSNGINFKMLAKLGGIFGAVAIITKAIMGLKPIQAILEMINKIIQMFFLPFAMMLFRLLKPALVWLLKLMMMWIRFWKDPIGNLKKVGEDIIKGIGEFFSGIGEGVGKFADWVVGGAESIWDKIKSYGEQAWNVLKGLGTWIWNGITTSLSTTWSILKGFGKWLWNGITTNLIETFKVMQTIGSFVFNVLKNIFVSAFSVLKDIGTNIWNTLVQIFGQSFKILADTGKWLWDAITDPIYSGLDVLKDLGKKILDWAWGKISGMVTKAVRLFTPKKEKTTETTVRDAVITPTGQIIRTSPQDYLIATKNPTGGNTFNIHITLNREEENISRQITRALTHELSRYGRW